MKLEQHQHDELPLARQLAERMDAEMDTPANADDPHLQALLNLHQRFCALEPEPDLAFFQRLCQVLGLASFEKT
ncbi:MAG: hypothetical protein MI924_22310 [Chloroflexales bacterium]|nr:hypothetical protein [Chloroflexales bacterium]